MFCPMCGAPNEEGAVYCGNCGAALNPDAGQAVEKASAEVVTEAEELEQTGEEALAEVGDLQQAAEEHVAGLQPEVPLPPAAPEQFRAPDAPVPPQPARPALGVPTSGLAVASLVLGIGGLTVLPLIGSIAAIILGYMARNDIRRRPGVVSGNGLALAGIITGWVAVGAAVLVFLLVALGITASICGLGLFGLSGGAGY